MNQRDSEHIHELCARIAVEQDRQKFLELAEELNRVLSTGRLPASDVIGVKTEDRNEDPDKS